MTTIRRKPISGKRSSLYLDFYPAIMSEGKLTRRKFLSLYVYDRPKTSSERDHNKLVMNTAKDMMLRMERTGKTTYRSDSFLAYFRELADRHSGSSRDSWLSVAQYLESFGDVGFDRVTDVFCTEFKAYLLTTDSRRSKSAKLSRNSAVSYFSKFLSAIRMAHMDGLIPVDWSVKVDHIRKVETRRNYLPLEELNRLLVADCGDLVLKRAALFSALTGIRFSDIEKMTWGEVEYADDQGYYIRFTQQKTGGVETMPVSDQAVGFMGDRHGSKDLVFEGLRYSASSNRVLARWIALAGVSKKITFHCFRHTFATLQLSLGTDIYTVSKMLGHRDLKTTQVYARIIDQTKREAAGRIRLG